VIDYLLGGIEEIARQQEAEGVILTGGLGILLKQADLKKREHTPQYPIPEARATLDIDMFVRIQVMMDAPRLKQFGEKLEESRRWSYSAM